MILQQKSICRLNSGRAGRVQKNDVAWKCAKWSILRAKFTNFSKFTLKIILPCPLARWRHPFLASTGHPWLQLKQLYMHKPCRLFLFTVHRQLAESFSDLSLYNIVWNTFISAWSDDGLMIVRHSCIPIHKNSFTFLHQFQLAIRKRQIMTKEDTKIYKWISCLGI